MILRLKQLSWSGKLLAALAGFGVAASFAAGGFAVVDAAASKPTPAPPGPPAEQNKDFHIAGDVSVALAPGGSQRVDLRLSNDNNFGIQITDIAVTVQAQTTRSSVVNPSCNGPQNLVVASAFSGTPVAVVVPKNATKRLSELGVPQNQWPLVQMRNLSTNQDGCKDTKFQLSYQGTAVKS